jgi:hypothetical protein
MIGGRLAATLVALAAAGPAQALEARFDHRNTFGPVVSFQTAYDTLAITGRVTTSSWRPSLRIAYGFAVSDEGDELMIGADAALRSWDDPDRERIQLALDLRYRNYFGSEHLKTFFDAGVWVPLRSRVAIGPLLGFGAIWDFDRAFGVFGTAAFGTAFGQARIASFSGTAGLQVRFE